MHRATEEKLQLIAIQIKVSTVNFFLHTYINNWKLSSITKEQICCHPPSINLGDLISYEMTYYKK